MLISKRAILDLNTDKPSKQKHWSAHTHRESWPHVQASAIRVMGCDHPPQYSSGTRNVYLVGQTTLLPMMMPWLWHQPDASCLFLFVRIYGRQWLQNRRRMLIWCGGPLRLTNTPAHTPTSVPSRSSPGHSVPATLFSNR